MKAMLTEPRSWWIRQSTRRKVVYIALVVVAVLLVLRHNTANNGDTIETVKRQTLIRSVSASGSVVSSTDLSLGFEQSKVVESIKVDVGDNVKKGDILASLSNATERAALASAKGTLLAARARYDKVLEGSSSEEIKLAEVQLSNTQKTQASLVNNARQNLYSDSLVADPQGDTVGVAPVISGNYNGTDDGEYRISFRSSNSTDEFSYNGLETGTGEVATLPQPLGTHGLLISFPDTAVNRTNSWKILIPNKNGANYVANLNAYQAALTASDAAIAESQASLDLTRATARQPDIDAALADIVTAQAGVDTANAALEKTILRAPADGTITAVNIKIGEIPELGKIAIALQDVSNLYIEANINESNIKSVQVGQPVMVTFDAFTGDTYQATVSSIDPAATIENNVVNYKIKALLTSTDGIRPGMTANLTIQTAELSNVLVLPGRVITEKNGHQTVMLVTNNKRTQAIPQEITTGLKGDGDMVEIQSGLAEGDQVEWNPTAK